MEEGNHQQNTPENNPMGKSPKKLRNIDKLASNVLAWSTKDLVMIGKKRIDTWKAVLILTFISGVVVATVWGVSGRYFQQSMAGFSTALILDAPTNPVIIGDTFDVDVVIDTDDEDVVAVKAVINYDENSFALQNVDTSNSAFAVDNTCQYQGKACEIINRDDTNGQVTIVLSKPSPGINTQSGMIGTLTFLALAETSATDNISIYFVGQGNYTDSDMILDDSSGVDTLDQVVNASVQVIQTPPPVCTDYTTSVWSTCVGGTQTRTVTGIPAGCSGGATPPPSSQSCTELCTDYNTGLWSACVGGTQTRIVTGIPTGCSGGATPPASSQSCTETVTCSSYTTGNWSECVGGMQTRTVTGIPAGCSGGATPPASSQSCTSVGDNTCTSFEYSNWSACSEGIQVRTVTLSLPEGCTGGDPELEQSCVLTDEGPTAITDDNRPIKIEGEKQKFSKGDTFYSKEKKISFQGGNSDIANGRVKIYEGSSLKKEVTAGSDGKWKASIKVKKSDDYKFKLEYYNASGAKIAESSKYVVKVDDKDPKITDLPLILN